jgi:DNA-binding PadR family transcriptional regulator
MDTVSELTVRETGILLALGSGELSGYGIVRQCRLDTAGDIKLSNGTLFPALKRMEKMGAVEKVTGVTGQDPKKGRLSAKSYRMTRLGRQLLELQLGAYRRMVRLGQERI